MNQNSLTGMMECIGASEIGTMFYDDAEP